MQDRQLIDKIKQFKEERHYTRFDLARKIEVQVTTLERWFKTGRINRLYAKFVKEKLGL